MKTRRLVVQRLRWIRKRTNGWVLLAGLTLFLLLQGELLAATERVGHDRPKAAEPDQGRVLGEQIEIEDRSGHALDRFHAALDRAAQRRGQARVVWWGASHTAGDEYVGLLRGDLQERFGDAGPGFVIPVKPFLGWNHRAAHVESGGAWRILRGDRGPVGESYGFGGYAAESLVGGAWGSLDTARATTGPRRVGAYEVFFLHQPGGGRFEVRIDARPAAVVDTDSETAHSGYARFRVHDGEHRIAVRALDDRPTRIFGVSMERDRSGVIIDTLGIPGSRARSHLRWDDTIYREQLRRRRPDLVVLAYGTNESEDVEVPLRRYESDLTRVVRRVRQTVPSASCLLVGPSDRPLRLEDRSPGDASPADRAPGEGAWGPRPLTADVIEVQRRVAAEQGCGFFDLVSFMGGPMSMLDWVAAEPAYGRDDHVHFTWHGHRRLADVLGKALVNGYDARYVR